MHTAPPPLPDAPALTTDAAATWRSGRVWQWLDSRWVALLPVMVVVVAVASDASGSCPTPASCASDRWQGAAAVQLLIIEAVVLLAKVRRRAAFVTVVGALLWLLPSGLPNQSTRLTAIVAHALVAAVLFRAEAARRRVRQQLDALMGPPVAYPWTAAGSAHPGGGPGRSRVRGVLAGLLIAASAVLVALGMIDQSEAEARIAAATQVEGTVLDGDSLGAEVAFRRPGGATDEKVSLTITWDYTPRAGDRLLLLADGRGFVGIVGDTPDIDGWLAAATLAGTVGVLLAASAAGTVRRYRAFAGAAGPAMRVLVQPDRAGDLLVRPADGDLTAPGLWRLRERAVHRWRTSGEDAPAWVAERRGHGGCNAPGGSGDPVRPEGAAEAPDQADRPVPALLYHGPGGRSAQLLVFRSPAPDADWLAVVAHERPAAPRFRRRDRYREDQLAVAAIAAKALAEAPDGPAERARRIEMPALLRCTAGPLLALLMGACVYYLGGDFGYQGLFSALFIGTGAFVSLAGACTWQIDLDRDGLTIAATALVHRYPWAEVEAAAVHRGRLTIQRRGGGQVELDAWPARMLGKRLGGPAAPLAVAATITLLANRPERRPEDTFAGSRIGRPHLLINRIALGSYLLFVLARFLVL
ncbi:hypothetical protein [Kitasatospora sp. MBT63]|uniref:hypothetical protein n=1 Tax=Kitasatospora sp. MBT63 TaxID=1444768 RepID=UPI00053B61DD|nr:hypothetical protein [Kitasatospora sp. MBT63]